MGVAAPANHDLETLLGGGDRMAFQLIPAGAFQTGLRGEHHFEEPVHAVRITRPFYLGTFPVTQQQFAVWTAAAGIEHTNHFAGNPTHPAENMNWHEAMKFCEWLNGNVELPDDHQATLPTEAQWEYACRAGTDTEYYAGDGEAALAEAGWYDNNADGQTHQVGLKLPNAFRLYDMHGNVWEWCRDVWDRDAYKKRVDGVADPEVVESDDAGENTVRVIRGGSWGNSPGDCRAAVRYGGAPGNRDWDLGFRVCLVPGPSGASQDM